jgi:lipid-A-disaccharide synthase-like uncharacterized protein
MNWSDLSWMAVGFAAQGFFSARFLLQWILSERARRSLMPVHFWYFSLLGSVLLMAYAIHRRDPVITAGQVIGLGIYLRNLQFIHFQRVSPVPHAWLWLWLLFGTGAALVGYHLGPNSATRPLILDNFWTTFGFIGQALFTGRFVVQWFYTEREKRSVMPRAFWYLSIVGSLMLFVYATAVVDPVIMLGQSLGLVIYIRNLILLQRSGAYQTDLSST